MTKILNAIGYQARSGRRYGRIDGSNGECAIWPIEKFSLANKKLTEDLAAAGFPVFGKSELDAVVAQVRAISVFEDGGLAEHVGWNREVFACRDGTVLGTAQSAIQAPVVYTPDHQRTPKIGKLVVWKSKVAKPLSVDPVAGFLTMAMFAAPILRHMPGIDSLTFETVGDVQAGKSCILTLAASVLGSAQYVRSLQEVLHNTPDIIRDHCDYPLLIDNLEPSLMGAGKAQLAAAYQTVTFAVPRAPGGRVTVLAGARPFHETCRMTGHADLVFSLPVSSSLPQITATDPATDDVAPSFSSRIPLAAAVTHHGHAYPKFIKMVQRSQERDLAQWMAHLATVQDEFKGMASVDGDDHARERAIQAFGAVYAVGCMARSYQVLPNMFPCCTIALAAYKLWRDATLPASKFLDRLEELAGSGRLVTITRAADQDMQMAAAAAAIGTLTVVPNKRVIKIDPDKITQAFPDWALINKNPDVRERLVVDGKNLKAKGYLAPGCDKKRLYQFQLPPAEILTMFDPDPQQAANETSDE